MFKFAHYNFNVLNLDKSIEFYKEALELKEKRRITEDEFTIVFLTDSKSGFELELTNLKEQTKAYNLGDNEMHLAIYASDFDKSYELHKSMGCICYENKEMGIYFISDPDGYWIEIIPSKSC